MTGIDKPELRSSPSRRRASALYGLIIAGAVLATSGTEERLWAVAASLLATLAVYWLAETYVHFMSERAVERRPLDRRTAAVLARDGLPLISASLIPLAALLVAGLVGQPVAGAADWALYATTAALLLEGYRISRDAGVVGVRLVAAVAFTGLLGVAMIVLKASVSH